MIFFEVLKFYETLETSSKQLAELFEGDSADTCAVKFLLVLIGGPSRGSRVRRPGSKDLHLYFNQEKIYNGL